MGWIDKKEKEILNNLKPGDIIHCSKEVQEGIDRFNALHKDDPRWVSITAENASEIASTLEKQLND